MQPKKSSGGYAIAFAVGLAAMTMAALGAFWQVTGSEVKRSAAEAAERNRPPPPPVVDTTPGWQPTPEAAMLDSVFVMRNDGRLSEALEVLERWLKENPLDRPRRLDAARLAFEAERRERGVTHYRAYLASGEDGEVLREAVRRIVAELPPAVARKALASMLRVDDDVYTVRIGLARATADAEDPVGADTLLRPIPPRWDPAIDAFRLMVRRAQNPDIPTAERWVEEYPEEVLYRLVLARSLSRAGRPAAALPHYLAAVAADTSLDLREEAADVAVAADSLNTASLLLQEVLGRDPSRDRAMLAYGRTRARLGDNQEAVRAFEVIMGRNPDEALFNEARGVLFEVNDVALTLPLLARLVAFRPEDDALRLRYAQDLERTRAFPQAEVQYDTLLMRAPTAALFLTRARVRVAQNNLDGAIADAAAAEGREPSVDAALMQGDIHRWRQERELSRLAYDRAAALAPNDPRVLESRRLLAVQRRDALTYEPAFGAAASTNALGDSDGFESFLFRAQYGAAPLADETVLLAGAELRRATGALGLPLNGFGGDIGVSRHLGRFTLLGRVGAVAFDGGSPSPTFLLELTQASPTRSFRVSLGRQPAYESLRSGDVLAADDVRAATTLLSSLSQQLSPRIDVYVQADHARLGDGNGRSVVAAAVRRQMGGPWALLYTASGASFGNGTVDYWSPSFFITQGVAVDARRDRPRGWSLGARLAPAIAWSKETAPGRPTSVQSALQATLSTDATWRTDGIELGVFAGYGQDRAGTYAAAFGGLRARVTR